MYLLQFLLFNVSLSHLSFFPLSPFPLTFLYVLCGCDLEHTGVLSLHYVRGRLFDIWKHLCAHGLNESDENLGFEKRNELGNHE